jgi:hypothetical protein
MNLVGYRNISIIDSQINLKCTHIISILVHILIKFQVQNLINEGVVKKTKILTDLNS